MGALFWEASKKSTTPRRHRCPLLRCLPYPPTPPSRTRKWEQIMNGFSIFINHRQHNLNSIVNEKCSNSSDKILKILLCYGCWNFLKILAHCFPSLFFFVAIWPISHKNNQLKVSNCRTPGIFNHLHSSGEVKISGSNTSRFGQSQLCA